MHLKHCNCLNWKKYTNIYIPKRTQLCSLIDLHVIIKDGEIGSPTWPESSSMKLAGKTSIDFTPKQISDLTAFVSKYKREEKRTYPHPLHHCCMWNTAESLIQVYFPPSPSSWATLCLRRMEDSTYGPPLIKMVRRYTRIKTAQAARSFLKPLALVCLYSTHLINLLANGSLKY